MTSLSGQAQPEGDPRETVTGKEDAFFADCVAQDPELGSVSPDVLRRALARRLRATDPAPMCGPYPQAAASAKVLHWDSSTFQHETGMRLHPGSGPAGRVFRLDFLEQDDEDDFVFS